MWVHCFKMSSVPHGKQLRTKKYKQESIVPGIYFYTYFKWNNGQWNNGCNDGKTKISWLVKHYTYIHIHTHTHIYILYNLFTKLYACVLVIVTQRYKMVLNGTGRADFDITGHVICVNARHIGGVGQRLLQWWTLAVFLVAMTRENG